MKYITTRKVNSWFGLFKRPALALKRESRWNMTVTEWRNEPKSTEFIWFKTAVDYNRFGNEIKGSERPITGDEEVESFKNFRDAMEILSKKPRRRMSNIPETTRMAGGSFSILGVIFLVRSVVNLDPFQFGLSVLFGGLGYTFLKSSFKNDEKLFNALHRYWARNYKREIIAYYLTRDIPDEFFKVDEEMASLLYEEVSNLNEELDDRPECRKHWTGD